MTTENDTPDTFTPQMIGHLHASIERARRKFGDDLNDCVRSNIANGHRLTIFTLWGAFLQSNPQHVEHCRLSWDAGDTAPDVVGADDATRSWVRWLERSGFIEPADRKTMLDWMDNTLAVRERRN